MKVKLILEIPEDYLSMDKENVLMQVRMACFSHKQLIETGENTFFGLLKSKLKRKWDCWANSWFYTLCIRTGLIKCEKCLHDIYYSKIPHLK
jgi:hypothetical protein